MIHKQYQRCTFAVTKNGGGDCTTRKQCDSLVIFYTYTCSHLDKKFFSHVLLSQWCDSLVTSLTCPFTTIVLLVRMQSPLDVVTGYSV